MAKDDPHFRLRIPETLKNQIESAAESNHRSINAEIIHRLEQSFATLPDLDEDDLQAILRQIDVVKYNIVKAHSKKNQQNSGD
ncbi:Arc family DNA-binding protein [Agrobacterium vitis]|uniref:Arc family DNA-binding protein n=1 Tax=Agrobacterium vitis TaxID=373 RepID=UPI0015731BC3|nr:Arc family DNA-binding protein [Agrobacterium vitis]NSY21881.1 Arc family DNA-binding protein [Agrobacterium vitis]WEO73171.1 Arc family DNA-binding protein [Agrobacterium vitis]